MGRTIAWQHNYRRLVTRYEHDPGHFLACLRKVLERLKTF